MPPTSPGPGARENPDQLGRNLQLTLSHCLVTRFGSAEQVNPHDVPDDRFYLSAGEDLVAGLGTSRTKDVTHVF